MKGYIYKITSPSGKIYIGQTNDIEKRKIHYEKLLCKAQRLLYSSIKKYGWDNHKLEVLLEVNDVSELLQLEIETIFKHKTNTVRHPNGNGMNLTDGGEGVSGPKSNEWKNKMKEKWASKEYREKLSKIFNTLEHKEICRNRQIGKKLSEETKNKMKERWDSNEYKEKMSIKLKKPKIPRTLEHSLKISKSNKGKIFSDEHKTKLRNKKIKPIVQINLDGQIVKEWVSIKQAEVNLGIYNISRVCKGNQETAGGYKWKYKTKENE
jgi:group I intron endonuclease